MRRSVWRRMWISMRSGPALVRVSIPPRIGVTMAAVIALRFAFVAGLACANPVLAADGGTSIRKATQAFDAVIAEARDVLGRPHEPVLNQAIRKKLRRCVDAEDNPEC